MKKYSTIATTIEDWIANRDKDKAEIADPISEDVKKDDMEIDSDLQDEIDELNIEGIMENTKGRKRTYRSLAEWKSAAVKFYDTKTDVEHLDGMTFSDWLNKHDIMPMRRTENGEIVRRSIAFEV